ncbi:hypothetical protein [Roseomonas chloroacetimidivorans]|jgi:hypothetical protein|uniref:hypothetical protein n=1 Tax=Roseomonas chloroacetimidivorans TaxID=1766656 RepID=UPI003C7849BC
MHTRITVHASPDRLFAWLSEPGNARHWFAHLRHEADGLPDPGLSADPGARIIRWTASPAGEMAVIGKGDVADLSLTFAGSAEERDEPHGDESPNDPTTNAASALRSIKSHVEAADGGDPDLHTLGVVSKEDVEEARREQEADPNSGGTPIR